MTVDDQFRIKEAGTPLLSPDGNWVLFSVETMSLKENARHSRFMIAPANGSARPSDFLKEGDSQPMWSPSSKSVFFLRGVGEGQRRSTELFEKAMATGEEIQRSHVGPGPGGSWQISSRGDSFLVLRAEANPYGPSASSDAVFVDEGSNGQTGDTWRNLWRFDLSTGKLRRVTQRAWWVSGADISPDGRRAVVSALPDNGRNSGWKSELYEVDLGTGKARQLTHNRGPEASPLWSPDGEHVLFSAVRLDTWEYGNGDLWLLDTRTLKVRNLTPNHTGRFAQPTFTLDGKALLVPSGYGTARFPVAIDVASGRTNTLVDTQGAVRMGSWSKDRRTFAYAYTDASTPADVYVGRLGNRADRQTRITDLNPWVREEIVLGSVKPIRWRSFDGRTIEGLLYLPPGVQPKKLPLIVHVPCGPGCAWLNTFSTKHQIYAGLGYAQLAPNIRGASNYDDDHMHANRFDIGGGDRRDVMTGIDFLISKGIVDGDRLGIDGWSYGAVLGGYTLTKTNRFKAASLGAMVSDWVSEYGVSANYDVERWYIGGNPWTNPEKWRERSALTHADRVKTPTLLHHGDEDTTDSPSQSMNYFVALRKAGTIARYIRYPGEGHDLYEPQHIRLRDMQDVAWMERFVRGR